MELELAEDESRVVVVKAMTGSERCHGESMA